MLSKLGEDGLVEKVLDILSVVEGSGSGGSLVGSFGARRDSREDSFEDTQSSEVREGALKLLQGLVSGGVVLGGWKEEERKAREVEVSVRSKGRKGCSELVELLKVEHWEGAGRQLVG